MENNELEIIMEQIAKWRKKVISEFAGISVSMDAELCIPSVHSSYQGEELVVDFCGRISMMTEGFPEDKKELFLKWVSLHESEILKNHDRINHIVGAPNMIEPLEL